MARWTAFKAVYPRQDRFRTGIALVPRAPDELGRTLSWLGRYALRSGDGFAAHNGTITVWANEIGLDRNTLLRELQARIVRAR